MAYKVSVLWNKQCCHLPFKICLLKNLFLYNLLKNMGRKLHFSIDKLTDKHSEEY